MSVRGAARKVRRMLCIVRAGLVCLIALAVALLFYIVPYRVFLPAAQIAARREGEMRLHFLSVGQGDCTIVEFPDGSALVVDAGDGSFANDDYIVRYIKGLAPASLMLAATHADSDHYGGLTELLRVFDVEKVYLPAVGSETGAYARLLSAVEQEGCATETFVRYKSLLDRSGAYLVCISPHAEGETDENEAAAMLYLEYEGVRVVLSSDTSSARERELLAEYALSEHIFDHGRLEVDLTDIDLLKVAHHGSAGATSAEWLALLSPAAAVISCGAGNSYGHPAEDTLRRLFEAGAEHYRTDELGTVVASIDGGACTIHTHYSE